MTDKLSETRRLLLLLDLRPGATLPDVKAAYRTLAKVWHPDRFGQDPKVRSQAEERLKAINLAYDWLTEHAELLGQIAQAETPRSGPAAPQGPPSSPSTQAPPRKPGRRGSLKSWFLGVCIIGVLGYVVVRDLPPNHDELWGICSDPRFMRHSGV